MRKAITHMAQSLEKYMAETAKVYQPAQQAIQNQINAVGSDLNTTTENINRQYAEQQKTLERNRDDAARSASLQAAGNGGSFGGQANIANREYYKKTFTPAVSQLQTNQANDLATARQTANNNKLSLEAQLANLAAESGRYATERYDTATEAARQDKLARDQMAQNQNQFDANLKYNYYNTDLTNKYNYDALAQNQRQFDTNLAENRRQFDTNLAWQKDSFAQNLAENQRQFNTTNQYNYDKMAQEADQFNRNLDYSYYNTNTTKDYNYAKLKQDNDQFERQLEETIRSNKATEDINRLKAKSASSGSSSSAYYGGYYDGVAGANGAQAATMESSSGSPYRWYQDGSQWTFYDANTNNNVRLGTFVEAEGGDFNSNLRTVIDQMAASGDYYATIIQHAMTNGVHFRKNAGDTFQATGNDVYDTLGIIPTIAV